MYLSQLVSPAVIVIIAFPVFLTIILPDLSITITFGFDVLYVSLPFPFDFALITAFLMP